MSSAVRVRYAPSPTGHLHIGGARTALFDYLLARHMGGQFIIRFEDTDQTRHNESGIESQLAGLRWLGLEWDESVDVGGPYAPYRQMERLHLYQPYTEQLLNEGNAYYCYCTPEELDQERQAQEASGEMPQYAGKCRHLSEEQRRQWEEEGRKPSIRFRVPEQKTIVIEDQVRGRVTFESSDVGDFILVRPDGIPTYNFAVILDDHLMNITTVIRGEEHLSNTPRQVLLYDALGLQPPQFAHISLILNQDRKKMSKRDESIIQFMEQYNELGYLPEAVLNFIVLLGWSPKGEQEIFTKEELIEQFTLERVAKSPAVFDPEKLNWMNNEYIKKAELSRIVDLAIPHLQKAGRLPAELDAAKLEWATQLIGLYQEQLRYVAEITELSEMFFIEEPALEEEAQSILKEAYAPIIVQSFIQQLEQAIAYTPETIKSLIKQVQKDTGYKGKPLFMSIRAAATGQTHGRDLNQTLYLLGKEKVLSRLQKQLLFS